MVAAFKVIFPIVCAVGKRTVAKIAVISLSHSRKVNVPKSKRQSTVHQQESSPTCIRRQDSSPTFIFCVYSVAIGEVSKWQTTNLFHFHRGWGRGFSNPPPPPMNPMHSRTKFTDIHFLRTLSGHWRGLKMANNQIISFS